MKQDHRPWDEHRFDRGANTDGDGEAIAPQPGVYRDAQNMRIADPRASTKALRIIDGETVRHGPDRPGGSTYRCIGAIRVGKYRVTFWASTQPNLYAPIIRINGVTMVQSSQLPYLFNRKLQLHQVHHKQGGWVFDARSGDIPLHWDINDIVRAFNANEQTYFSGFDISAVQVNPTRPINRPQFLGLVQVGTGTGVHAGQRWYWIRLRNSNGDATPDGPDLGPVHVPWESSTGGQTPTTPALPHAGIGGSNPGFIGVPTGYGVRLRYRVNNRANFESVEIVCLRYDENGGPDAVPVIEVVKRHAIVPGENTPYEYIDAGNVEEEIPIDEAAIKPFFIKSADSVRNVGYRVVYGGVVLGRRKVAGTFLDADGERLFPYTRRIGIEGHSSPVNHCYYRRFQSGERYGIGVVYRDAAGNDSWVDPVDDDLLLPTRRTEKSDDSLKWSDAPCHAANINNEVTPTFEVFDHDTATGRTQTRQVLNVMSEARRKQGAPDYANQASTDANELGNGAEFPPYGFNNDGTYGGDNGVGGGPWVRTNYIKPFRPTGPLDFKFGLDYRVNTQVGVAPNGDDETWNMLPYDPKVFNVQHHSMGLALRGFTEKPLGTQGFSMVMTEPAGQVVTQGIATWKLVPGSANGQVMAGKEQYRIHVFLPDHAAGALNQEVWEGIQSTPSRYKVQFASPLGICTQQFGSVMARERNDPPSPLPPYPRKGVSVIADLLSIARVLWDTGQINPGNNSGGSTPAFGIPGNPDHFTNYGSWRNPIPQVPGQIPWNSPGADGDKLVGITFAQEHLHDNGERSLVLTMDEPIYYWTGAGSMDFNALQTQAMHEPFYVVNIVQTGREPDKDKGYRTCNHWQAWEAEIGRTDGQAGQQFLLVDENRDLVYSTVDGQERFVWVRTPNGTRPYLYIGTFWGSYAAIQASLAATGSWTTPGGVVIYGLYDIQFGITALDMSVVMMAEGLPPADCIVEVRYRFGADAVPTRFHGDMVSAPAVATIVDTWATARPQANADPIATNEVDQYPAAVPSARKAPVFFTTSNNETPWFNYGPQVIKLNGLPIPYANYRYNDRYLVPFGHGFGQSVAAQGGQWSVNQFSNGKLMSTRQWKVMFDCEVRAPLHLAMFEPGTPNRCYGPVNYIQRPYNFEFSNDIAQNGVYAEYALHYPGDASPDAWQFGGIKSRQLVLPDHAIARAAAYFEAPEFGYTEEEEQRNAVVFSLKDSPLTQDAPGWKTFPTTNIEFIEPDTGGIQRLYSAAPAQLYVICERGTYEAIIERAIASSADGTDFSLFASDRFIGTIVARSKNVGMAGDSWQSAAEGAPFIGDNQRQDALVWIDGDSAHMLTGGAVVDIAVGRYRRPIRELRPAVFYSGVYDRSNDEFWHGAARVVVREVIGGQVFERQEPGHLLVYAASAGTNHWQGRFTYAHDDYVHFDDDGLNGRVYGLSRLTEYELNAGPTIGSAPVVASVKVASAPFPRHRTAWMRFYVDSTVSPLRMEFYDEDDQLVCWTDAATFGPNWIKKQDGWEHWIPSRNAQVDPARKRLQGRVAYAKAIWSDGGGERAVMLALQAKPLK